jgi:F0F1-type ATP synthase membrane subunit c/vacuolar-type H+-ATPase subunit K
MNSMRTLVATLAFGLALTGAAVAQDDLGTPYVQAFCVLSDAESGMGRLYLVTPGLSDAIMAAVAENERLQATAPDEKPPLGDGIPWQSMPDVAPVCEAGATTADGDRLIAQVRYRFPATPDADWIDRLVLVKGADGAYTIDDVLYGEEGEESLRGVLKDAFAQ